MSTEYLYQRAGLTSPAVGPSERLQRVTSTLRHHVSYTATPAGWWCMALAICTNGLPSVRRSRCHDPPNWFRPSVRLSICDRIPGQSTMSQDGRASARSVALRGGNFAEVQSSDYMYSCERIFRRASRRMAFARRYPMIYLGPRKRSVLLSRLC